MNAAQIIAEMRVLPEIDPQFEIRRRIDFIKQRLTASGLKTPRRRVDTEFLRVLSGPDDRGTQGASSSHHDLASGLRPSIRQNRPGGWFCIGSFGWKRRFLHKGAAFLVP